MYFFGSIEAVKQFQYISVKFIDIGYFHVEPHTLTGKNLIRANSHSPANKWKIQCKLPPKTKRFCPLVLK